MAWFLRSRPVWGTAAGAVALDQEQFGLGGIFFQQSFSFPARKFTSIAVLRRVSSRALRAASRARAASMILRR